MFPKYWVWGRKRTQDKRRAGYSAARVGTGALGLTFMNLERGTKEGLPPEVGVLGSSAGCSHPCSGVKSLCPRWIRRRGTLEREGIRIATTHASRRPSCDRCSPSNLKVTISEVHGSSHRLQLHHDPEVLLRATSQRTRDDRKCTVSKTCRHPHTLR